MELGEKLRLARQEAGLSQRQLCGDVITRNMLSQIEHGTARPSMETLRHLAAGLGKPVSFFLEDAVTSPNWDLMEQAKKAVSVGKMDQAGELLCTFRHPDPVLEWQWRYLSAVVTLAVAEQALQQEKPLYARQILEEVSEYTSGFTGLERERLLLLGRIPGTKLREIVRQLPSLDQELMLRAEEALTRENPERAAQLLAAVEDQKTPEWNLLQGRQLLASHQFASAAQYLELAEPVYPKVCWPLLEICWREAGDFQKAYFYACKQK